MSSSFRFDHPARFVAGAVGEPGARVFYLQVTDDQAAVVSFKCEKAQVAALAEHLAGMLADLPEPGEEPAQPGPLVEPVLPEWVVGTLGLAYDETVDRVVVVAEELTVEPDEAASGEPEPSGEAASARVSMTRGQAASFVKGAQDLVEAGRPPCPICGRPMDPAGHVCPRSNGQHPPR